MYKASQREGIELLQIFRRIYLKQFVCTHVLWEYFNYTRIMPECLAIIVSSMLLMCIVNLINCTASGVQMVEKDVSLRVSQK